MLGLNPYAIIVGLVVFGGSVVGAYWYGGSVREAQIQAAQAKATEAARARASEQKAKDLARIVRDRDEARAKLAVLSQQKPDVKVVTKTVEVPSDATTVECPDLRIGDGFTSLWNAAAEAHNAVHETRRGDGPAGSTGLRAPFRPVGSGPLDAGREYPDVSSVGSRPADRD